MDINRLTQKSIAAVQDAQSIASRNTNQQVDQQHLMKALLDQKLIAELITRMGKDKDAFDAALDGAIRDARGRDVKAIRGMLDVAALKASKDRTSDIQAALDALTKEKAWAFDAAPGGYPNVRDGGDPNKTPTGSTREQFAAWFNQVTK